MITITLPSDEQLDVTDHALLRIMERFCVSSDLVENIVSVVFTNGECKTYRDLRDIIKYIKKSKAKHNTYIEYADVILVIDNTCVPRRTIVTVLKKIWINGKVYIEEE